MKLGKTVGRNGWSKRHKRHWASQDAHDFTSKRRESCRKEMRHACPGPSSKSLGVQTWEAGEKAGESGEMKELLVVLTA